MVCGLVKTFHFCLKLGDEKKVIKKACDNDRGKVQENATQGEQFSASAIDRAFLHV